MEIQIEEAVCKWLRHELRLPEGKVIDTSTRINIDLGVAGDDGLDMMKAFCRQFGANVSELSLDQYFGREAAANPVAIVTYLIRVFGGKPACGLQPLYVSDLIKIATDATS